MVTSEQLERWEGMVNKATPGPWEYEFSARSREPHTVMGPISDGSRTSIAHTPWDRPREAETFQFIAESRTTMPLLIQRVRELMDEVECYEGMKDGVSVRIADLEAEVRRLTNELALWKPMTPEEAEKAYDEAEAVPMAPGEAEAIVEKMMASINDPLYRPTEPEYVQLVVEIRRLRKENAGLKLLHAIANHVEGDE
jgi:hypothetical protein